jgi:hypothetical protein
VLAGYPSILLKALPNLGLRTRRRLEIQAQKSAAETIAMVRGQLAEYRNATFTRPVSLIVDALPKDELAAMAESLVNLTSFKRRVSMDAETVAGPVDVAIISRGDGLVWIKRKHYFDAALNPGFMSRRYGPAQ